MDGNAYLNQSFLFFLFLAGCPQLCHLSSNLFGSKSLFIRKAATASGIFSGNLLWGHWWLRTSRGYVRDLQLSIFLGAFFLRCGTAKLRWALPARCRFMWPSDQIISQNTFSFDSPL